MQHILNDEIHEAWDRRDMKSAYKLLRQLAGSKFDVKKRDWRLIKQALPTRKEWGKLLQEAGCNGGMLAKTSTWQEMRDEHISVASDTPLPPKDMNQIMQAREDVTKLAQHVIFCKKRKLFLRIHYLLNCWSRCLPPTTYKDPSNKLFNPCLIQYPPETHPPTTANLSTLSPGRQSMQQKEDPTFMTQHTNPQTHQSLHQKCFCSTT